MADPLSPPSLRTWTRVPPDDGTGRLRLFCLPHAGGSASMFAGWQRCLPAGLHVCPIQLAGRQNRLAEPPFTRIEPLVERLAGVVEQLSDLPFAFFGHSMGGFIAFELARELRRRGARTPVALLIASCRAAHLPTMAIPMSGLPTPDFLEALRQYAGIPASMLANRELVELMLPTLRADVELVESYRFVYETPLDCAIFAYGGCEPGDVSIEQLSAWQQLTRGAFRVQTFPGSHFFLDQSQSALLQAIQSDLSDYLAQSAHLSTP
jgi:medium-chain acyl-[acyl-carrier-protein] hydrolase